MVTIAKAANELGVSTATVHRWLREGFICGEQITPGAPWQIQLTDELRARVCEHAPDGWLGAWVSNGHWSEMTRFQGYKNVSEGPRRAAEGLTERHVSPSTITDPRS